MSDYNDSELLELFRNPESRNFAFNLIIRKYQERIYWHVRRMLICHDDTNDVVQNTFIKVWKGLKGFREESKLYTWLLSIAINESLSFLKKKRIRKFFYLTDLEKELTHSLESDVYFEGNELQQKLQKAILTLPQKQRLVFNMKYFDNMKYEDMAEMIGTSTGALKASFHHAVHKIEKYLEDN